MSRLALALLALLSGCADTIDPHYLQAGQDPAAAVRALGYKYVEDESLEIRGITYCDARIVALASGNDDAVGAHEYIHVQQQIALGCKRKGDPDREAQAYLAIWIYQGCQADERDKWLDFGVDFEDMDSKLCTLGGPSRGK